MNRECDDVQKKDSAATDRLNLLEQLLPIVREHPDIDPEMTGLIEGGECLQIQFHHTARRRNGELWLRPDGHRGEDSVGMEFLMDMLRDMGFPNVSFELFGDRATWFCSVEPVRYETPGLPNSVHSGRSRCCTRSEAVARVLITAKGLPPSASHKSDDDLTYGGWIEKCNRNKKAGIRQKRCSACKLWYWVNEPHVCKAQSTAAGDRER